MSDRVRDALIIAAIALFCVVQIGEAIVIYVVASDAATLKHQVCVQSGVAQKGAANFQILLDDLAKRAQARERIDIQDKNVTQAQADADSFRLYTQVAASVSHAPPNPFCN